MIRSQCGPCPWRDMQWMRDHHPEAIAAAERGATGWHCHVRMGECPGPARAVPLTLPAST